jgi:hypothetical protein
VEKVQGIICQNALRTFIVYGYRYFDSSARKNNLCLLNYREEKIRRREESSQNFEENISQKERKAQVN